MKKFKTLLSLVVFIAVLAYALAFAARNSQTLSLDFIVGESVAWPTSLWLGGALLVGALLGFFSGMFIYTKQKLEIRRLRKELNNAR
ncbi:MAG: lipopolysaccharide assembly protein LapA domain-containing protein [Venatoribacter sp.]